MRRIVVDHARHHTAQKRTGSKAHVPLDQIDVGADGQTELILAVDEALTSLSAIDHRLVRVVEWRYFAGLTEAKTADALGTSLRSVQRHWLRARAWPSGGRMAARPICA